MSTGHGLDGLNALHLATVVDTVDPEARGRVRVRLSSTEMELWAPCVVNSAGSGYGVTMLPRIDEQVVVAFASPEQPLVLGAVWSGSDSIPDAADPVADHYSIETPGGSRIDIDESGASKLTIETPIGWNLTIDEGAGSLTLEHDAERIELSADGVSIRTPIKVAIDAGQVDVTASMVQVNAAMSSFSGVVKCDTLIATSVVGTSYTPGAGNIW